MIYFVTNDEWHYDHYKKKLYDDIEVINDNEETFKAFKYWIDNLDTSLIGYDVESNGLDQWINSTVLKIIGTEEEQFILHSPFCDTGKYHKYLLEKNIMLLGHNIKFDLNFLITENNIWHRSVWDTMIADQRIYNKLGLSSSLDALAERYLDVYPEAMDKSIRMEFVGVNVKTFKVKPKHLYYGAGDVSNLFPIKSKLEEKITKYSMEYLLYNIEFPLIPILAKAETTGFDFDVNSWKVIYEDNLERLFEIECKLDIEVRKLRDKLFNNLPQKRFKLVGGKWDNERIHNPAYDLFNSDGTVNTLNLFGEQMTINTYLGSKAKVARKIKKAPNNINYGSDIQIVEIFALLEQPVLTSMEVLAIPSFNRKGKIDKTKHSYTTKEDSLNTYLTMLPESVMKEFITLLIEHRGLAKAISTYGLNFINHLNKRTGKLHTVFGQCFTATCRMNSGGGDKMPDRPNFQNIPSRAEYAVAMRNCFLATHGGSMGTHDLSGAELIIMCSLSQDLKLLKIAMDDIHSYVAQGCWRLIYKFRALKLIEQHEALRTQNGSQFTDKGMVKTINNFINLAKTYVVNKTVKKVRTAFKPMTFGVIYGMFATKAAKTLNISKEEGQIVIDFIKAEFPDVIKMVEHATAFATARGYLILNSKTNSRMWFPNLIRLKRGEISERDSFGIISKEQSEARNGKIQGTQADMIKEASVAIQEWIDDNNLTHEITILSWIHDEIVDDHPSWLDGQSEEAWAWLQEGNCLYYNGNHYHSFPRVKAQIMRDVCNTYLNNVTMDVEYDVEPFWTK